MGGAETDSGFAPSGRPGMTKSVDALSRLSVRGLENPHGVIPAKAGLRRQDAEANIGEADGPKGAPQERRVIHGAFAPIAILLRHSGAARVVCGRNPESVMGGAETD
jgi:hypothetical protein